MSDWYYSHDGQQKGPVPVSELSRLASSGGFDPEKDLVWRDGMSDWKPAGEVPEIQLHQAPAASPEEASTGQGEPFEQQPLNPYATPAMREEGTSSAEGCELPEIEPGSEPIDIGAVISRAFELTKRHFGMILAIGIIMFAISAGASLIMGFIDELIGYTPKNPSDLGFSTGTPEVDDALAEMADQGSILTRIVTSIVDVFLGLGIIRVGLNIVDNKPFTISTLFSQGSRTLRGYLAQILFGLMIGLGFVLLVAPGIYLAARFGQYQKAIVDKDMGIFDSFGYSSRVTMGTKWQLIGLYLVIVFINLGGLLALGIGLIFTIPLTTVAGILAYRWLQHGSAITVDR